ncbi:MAG TPA: hypothetical protein DCE80_21835, partial [Ignavibacteriales bacterium]|nr:hypothetical protein [Ignavibacteriales bacterium]
NYSNKNVDNVIVSLFINNERSAQVSTNLSAGESKLLNVEAAIKSTGFISVFAEIEDDEILQDNRRYSSVFVPDNIPIIIFTDEPSDSRFVELALTAIENRSTFVISKKNLNELSAYDLKKYEVVIVIGSQNLKAADKLSNYVQEGGSLFIAPGSKSTLAGYQKLLNELGLSSPLASIGKINDPTNLFLFENTDLDHPVFQDIFTNKEKTKIESPEIYSYFKINTQGKGRSIITLQDGSSFLGEYKIKNGKIFLLSSSPILSCNNFPLKSIFVPLMNKSVLYLASKDKNETSVLAGEDIRIDVRGKSISQLKLLKPDNVEDFLTLNQSDGNAFVKYDKANLVGNYKIASGTKIIDEVSVNADPLESKVKYLDKAEIDSYMSEINFKGNFFWLNKEENIGDAILKARFGSELWKYFLLAALLLAFVEMLVARNAKKELVEVSK